MAPVEPGWSLQPHRNTDYQLSILKNAAPFDVEKQKVEITKLRATLEKRCLTQEAEKALFASSWWMPKSDEESKEVDPKEQRIAELKSRSMFGSASTNPRVVPYKNLACLFGEDRF
jgi:hypothetical protein